MMSKQSEKIYQLKITLSYIKPPVWRRVLVPGDTTLEELHHILLTIMGWDGYHLHEFSISGTSYGSREQDTWGELDFEDEADFTLAQVLPAEKLKGSYTYDFGDDWRHEILVEKILPRDETMRYPLCVTGKRACPPEDIGGPPGYQFFLEAIHDPANEEHERYLEWIGGAFDPEAFDLNDINDQLHQL
jgi:hypothetical protein